jgi:hypothetical protein
MKGEDRQMYRERVRGDYALEAKAVHINRAETVTVTTKMLL